MTSVNNSETPEDLQDPRDTYYQLYYTILNSSIMDINSTINSTLNFFDCFKQTHVGVAVMYVVMALCFFLGTPARSWLLWLSFRDGWKIKPTQVFSLNHTILELIYCILCAVEILNVLTFNSDTYWRVIYFVLCLSWVGRPLMQICISVEQYLAVLHPIMFRKYKGVQYRIATAAVVWLMVAAYGVYEAFEGTYPDPIFDTIFVTAVTVISFCCVSVLRALKHPGPGDAQNTMERGRDVGNQQKRNAFNIIFSGLLIILFTYLPQVVVCLISVVKMDKELFLCETVPLINCFNVLGVMITPLLKMYKHGHLKCLNHQREIKT